MSANSTSVYNWVDEPDGRGTWSILSTCILTIILCCWSSVYPNIPARSDGTLNEWKYKFNLFAIGILGPEFLLVLAMGQWSSARASVKAFNNEGYTNWTMTHAFFADMGGFLLESPGTELFPIDAKQLLELVNEGFVACPDLDAKDIKDKSKSDRLSRMIAILQAIWFLINCISRGAQRLSLTTLELTTISFTIIFLVTSFCWQHKPKDVSRAIILRTDASVDMIRERWNIGPEQKWYQTPLEFLSRKEYYCSLMWRYYVQILHYMHIPLFRRPQSRPYDRIPSDTFLDVDKLVEVIGGPSILLFSCMFIFAWSFDFPTPTERLLWRIAALYQVFFGTVGGIFSWYAHNYTLPKLQRGKQSDNDMATLPVPVAEHLPEMGKGRLHRLAWQLRNIHPDRDPYLEVPLKILLPNMLFSALYSCSRAYLITEDFIGLRSLPESAFQTVNWSNYIPHW